MTQRKKIILNIKSLFLLQGANYLLPLISIPYLIRVIGPDKYGLLALAAAFCQYFIIITDYGFNYTATRRIAVSNTNQEIIQKIYSTVMLIKLALMLLSLFTLVIIVFSIPYFRAEWPIYLIMFLSVIGSVLFPSWLYQGMESMKYITLLNIFAKVISTAAIFIFVKLESDYVLAALLQSLNLLVPGILSILLVRRTFNIRLIHSVKWSDVKIEIYEGWRIFSTTLAGNVYGQGAIIIVGLSAGKTSAGYYAIAQKIAVAISGLAQPFAQSLYPYLCNLYEENRSNYIKFKRNALLIGIIIFTIIGIVNYLFSDRISKLISGIIDKELVSLIEIYSVIIIMTMMNIMLNVFILSMKKFLEIQKMYLHAAAIFLIIGIPVTFIYGSQGMAFSIMIIESYILVSGFIIAKTPYHSLIKRSNYEQ